MLFYAGIANAGAMLDRVRSAVTLHALLRHRAWE